MAELHPNMTHDEAIAHLREEVCDTARRETGRLVDPAAPGLFGAVRGVMCDAEYVAALHQGWDGHYIRQLATSTKTVAFVRDVFSEASGDCAYEQFAPHLYQLYRLGTVHLRAPRIVEADGQDCSTQALTWALMYGERDIIRIRGTGYQVRHLVPREVKKKVGNYLTATMLPVSIRRLFDDFLAACELFAVRLDDEKRAGNDALLRRWWSTANTLAQPEPNKHLKW